MATTLVLRICSALALVYLASGASRQRLVAVSWEARENRLIAHNDTTAKDIIAVCLFSDSRLDFGWSSVYVKTDGRFKDSQQAYAAGYAEGTATSRMADEHYANMYGHYCDTDPAFCSRLFAFYRANLRSLLENAIQYGDRDPFWHQVELAVLQISGMQRGLTGAISIPYDPYEMPADFERLVLLNLYKDIGDLEWALGRRGPKAPRDPGVAFFKATSNNDEAIAAHASWGHYGAMNKLLKQYVFNYKLLAGSGQPVSATVVTFSGYPGGVSSGDDFFLTSTNLAVLGTGVRNQNSDLWSRLTPNNSVPSAFRSLAASRLSSSAKEWIHTYSRSSGGTGNSQWTVIDYNLFKRKVKKLPQDFVWYHEELPGYSMSADITSFVQTQGYWASYNIPYNNYENDPLAVCAACNPKYNAENALSARSDLNPSVGRYPFFEMGLRPHGGTDAKVVNSTMMARHSLWTQCGPTWYEKQAFSWSSSPFASVPHVGQPDYWSFPPAVKEWPDHVTLNSRE
ncbi:putative phospholipase B-like 2 isoform X4 [Dermacentor albipictus]|uniref:putative phospholipase B-like 2 isoform X4 n=1 Tax=Dermacentor albipictus TaxID=60249 RepID=UPI0031FD14CC